MGQTIGSTARLNVWSGLIREPVVVLDIDAADPTPAREGLE